MKKLSLRLLCQTYLLLLLLAASVLSSLPYSLLALALLVVVLFITFRSVSPRFNAVIILAVIFLLPLTLEPSLSYLDYNVQLLSLQQAIAAIAIIPAFYLLDYALRQNTQDMLFVRNTKPRHTTFVARALFVSVLVMLLVSLIISNRVLLFTDVILVEYLLLTLLRALRSVPELPIDIAPVWKRIIAGSTVDISLYATSNTSAKLYCALSPVDSWVKVRPQRFALDGDGIGISVTVTPSLSGPSSLQLQVSATDPWGFT